MSNPKHPIRIMNEAFHKYFTRQYKNFVLKESNKKSNNAVKNLSLKIERATTKLRYDNQ